MVLLYDLRTEDENPKGDCALTDAYMVPLTLRGPRTLRQVTDLQHLCVPKEIYNALIGLAFRKTVKGNTRRINRFLKALPDARRS